MSAQSVLKTLEENRVRLLFLPLVLVSLMFIFIPSSFSAEKMTTKIIVRVVSKDAKVIGSGVGGAFVRIKNKSIIPHARRAPSNHENDFPRSLVEDPAKLWRGWERACPAE